MISAFKTIAIIALVNVGIVIIPNIIFHILGPNFWIDLILYGVFKSPFSRFRYLSIYDLSLLYLGPLLLRGLSQLCPIASLPLLG